MRLLALYALPGVVLVSVLGALVTVLVMLRWGSSPADATLDEDLEGESDEARKLVRMVRRERAALRERAVRVGQTTAVVCFATATLLAVIALTSGGVRGPGALSPGADVEARTGPVKEAQARLEERLRAVEERLAAAKARAKVPPAASEGAATAPRSPTGERAAPAPPATPAPPAGPVAKVAPSLPSRAPESSRPDSVRGDAAPSTTVAPAPRPRSSPTTGESDETPRLPSAPSVVPRGQMAVTRTTVGDVKLEILRDPEWPVPGMPMTCTVRLADNEGTPLAGADVTVFGHQPDGSTVHTNLKPAESAGTYTGAVMVKSSGPWDLRLRVARRQTTFELDLTRPTAW